MRKTLDKESVLFINWAEEKLADYPFRKLLVLKAIYKFIRYINSVDLKRVMKKKLTKGGIEHGAPIYSQREVEKELEAEFQDLIGWQVVGLYNKEKK